MIVKSNAVLQFGRRSKLTVLFFQQDAFVLKCQQLLLDLENLHLNLGNLAVQFDIVHVLCYPGMVLSAFSRLEIAPMPLVVITGSICSEPTTAAQFP